MKDKRRKINGGRTLQSNQLTHFSEYIRMRLNGFSELIFSNFQIHRIKYETGYRQEGASFYTIWYYTDWYKNPAGIKFP